MPEITPELVLVVGPRNSARRLITRIRRAGWRAVYVDDREAVVAAVRGRRCAMAFVCVDTIEEWDTCWQVAAAAECPVAVYTSFLAPDRRFRETAFAARVAAYVAPSCTLDRLRDVITRLAAGERRVEVTSDAEFRTS